MQLNKYILKKQNVSKEQEKKIQKLYESIDNVFAEANSHIKARTLNKQIANQLSTWLTNIEFELQDNWNYNRNMNKHKYWYRLPGCTCPKLDNEERFGSEHKWYNMNCPYHGTTTIKEENES